MHRRPAVRTAPAAAIGLAALAATSPASAQQFSCIGFERQPPIIGDVITLYWSVLADVNNDGHLDLVLTDEQQVRVHYGAPGGFSTTFQALDHSNTRWVLAFDADGDGNLDIVSRRGVSLGDGQGAFSPLITNNLAGYLNAVTIDLDRDGLPDLITGGNFSQAPVNIYKNEGAGHFSLTGSIPGLGFHHAATDLNGDGHADFIAANTEANVLSIFWNTGEASLSPPLVVPLARIEPTAQLAPTGVIAADLDGDGDPDLITVNTGGLTQSRGSLSIIENDNGAFEEIFKIHLNHVPWHIAAADFDGDGKIDLVSGTAPIGTRMSLIRNVSAGGAIAFSGPVEMLMQGFPRMIRVGELDGQPGADIVSINVTNGEILTLFNRTPQGQPCVPDITGDSLVDASDLGSMISFWNQSGGQADVNADRRVNHRDMGLLLGAWGMKGDTPGRFIINDENFALIRDPDAGDDAADSESADFAAFVEANLSSLDTDGDGRVTSVELAHWFARGAQTP